MSKFATGVTVVTTVDDEGNPHAMTANSFTSVSLDPPTVLVCVGHSTHTYGFLETRPKFGISILCEEQQVLGEHFAKRLEDREDGVGCTYYRLYDDIPVLQGSIVSFACRVIGAHVYGDHTIYTAEVSEIRDGDEGDPLLFYLSKWFTPHST